MFGGSPHYYLTQTAGDRTYAWGPPAQADREKLFESYATIWAEVCSDESIVNQIAYDSHSPAYVRVNAILSTTQAFYETYGVEEGDGMYIAPENRISRWY